MMSKTVDLVRTLVRALGAFMMISGMMHFPLAVVLVVGFALGGQRLPNSPLGFLATCALQMGVFGLGNLAVGAVLIFASGSIARFAAKGAQEA
jgi:hypothetical protein